MSQFLGDHWEAGAYELSIDIPVAGNILIVVPANVMYGGSMPSGTTVTVEGVGTTTLHGEANAQFELIGNEGSTGIYTVHVTTVEGYLPAEDSAGPHQVFSLTNAAFANPRRVHFAHHNTGLTNRSITFFFLPYITADFQVSDAWVGEPVDGAALQFTATTGPQGWVHTTIDKYPHHVSYAHPWSTTADGSGPTNLILPALTYDVTITHTNFHNYTVEQETNAPTPGSTMALGTLRLVPRDANENGIADAWESLHFGANTTLDPDQDDDGDGLPAWAEYVAGTHPLDGNSTLAPTVSQATNNSGVTVSWQVTQGRVYKLHACSSLNDTDVFSAGPWTPSHGQTTMTWSDTNALRNETGYYWIEINVP